MKIKVKGLNTNHYDRKVKTIISNFFIDWELVEDDEDILLHFNLNNGVSLTVNNEFFSYDKSLVLTELQKISHCLYNSLSKYTGQELKWGIQTGVKPTKIVRKYLNENYNYNQIKELLQNNYLISNDKINLLFEIVKEQDKLLSNISNIEDEVSIYIGIPFCPTKCSYCSFPTFSLKNKCMSIEDYLDILIDELEMTLIYLKDKNIRVSTIYIGGGTPTTLSAQQLDILLNSIFKFIDYKLNEFTIEAGRPDTINSEKLHIIRKYNIDRISINPQTFNNRTLKNIGRNHNVEDIINKYHLARELGISNINMDIIIGLPLETIDEVTNTVDKLMELKPENVTVHNLALKKASRLTEEKKNNNFNSINDMNTISDSIYKTMKTFNYKPYYLYRQKNIVGNNENIGYTVDNKACIYNVLMMEELQTIIGVGLGSTSKFKDGSSLYNPKDYKSYRDKYKIVFEKKKKLLES